MTDQDERRRALGIPVHVSEEDHDWRSDGYCNCGASRFQGARRRVLPGRGRVVGKPNLDIVERNSEASF